MPRDSENTALLALMLVQDSRREARVRNGELVTLEDQDRSLWNRPQIREGLNLLGAIRGRQKPGMYELQAEIAAVHARAERATDTDWIRIVQLYAELLDMHCSPVVALNRAGALAMSGELEMALSEMDALACVLNGYYLLHAARADVLRRMRRCPEAEHAYRRALALATNPIERQFIERRLAELDV